MATFDARIRYTKTWEFDVSIEAEDEDDAMEKAEDYTPTDKELADENAVDYPCTRVLSVDPAPPHYVVISPDGIPIAPVTYESKASAEIALQAWCEHYEQQGYYSGVNGHIALADLPGQCKIQTVL